MSHESLLILYFLLAMVVSFLCSLMEAVLLSLTHAYILTVGKTAPKIGEKLKAMKENIDRPLSAILTLNTVAHTVGAAGVGAQVLKIWGSNYVALASAILTVLILIGSEIIPKTLGAVFWRQLAPTVGSLVWGLTALLAPLVRLFEIMSKWMTPKGKKERISREEMLAVAQIGLRDGTLLSQESKVIQNMLLLRNILAKDILTPRSVMLAFQQDKTVAEVLQKHSPIRFSRIPIYGKDFDDITGIVHRYEILQDVARDADTTVLKTIASPIHAIPETKSVSSTLDEFIKRREHIFLVVDEHGGTAGIVTLEDAVETLLGVEIVDEFDTVEDMRKLALQLWEKRKQKHNLD